MTIRERLERARASEFVTLQDAALLVTVSVKSIRRRLPRLTGHIARDGRIVRVRRTALLKLFGL